MRKSVRCTYIAGLCLAALIILTPVIAGIIEAGTVDPKTVSSIAQMRAVTLKNELACSLFSLSAEPQVIVGKEDWLYYAETVGDYTGSANLSQEEIGQIVEKLSRIDAYAKRNGACFIFICVPDKNAVYPEYMPQNIKRSSGERNCRTLCKALSAAGITAPDLLSVLLTDPADTGISWPVYYRTDTHWNQAGALLAANVLLDKTLGPGFKYDLSETVFELRSVQTGDLYKMLFPSKQATETAPETSYGFRYRYTTAAASPMDVVISTENEAGTGDLLCYRDSFGSALIPWLSERFNTATYIRGNQPYDFSRVGRDKPEFVVFEIAERNLRYILEGEFNGIEGWFYGIEG